MRALATLVLISLLALTGIAEAHLPDPTSVPRQEKLKVALMHDPPFTIKTAEGRWTGFNVDIWTQIAQILKLEYSYVEMPLQDMLEALENNTVDLSIACLFLTAQREERFEFSSPLGSIGVVLATLPDRIEHPWWSAMRIFISWGTLKVVVSLLLLLLVTGCAFWLIERTRNPEHFGGGLKGIGAGVYWAGSVLASGVCFGIYLKSLTGRIMGICWMFLCAIVFSAFIASLTSSLTLSRLVSTVIDIDTIKPLHLGVVKGGISEDLVKRMNIRCSTYRTSQEVFMAVINKDVDGYLYDEATLRYYVAMDYQDRIVLHQTMFPGLIYAFAFPIASQIRKPINVTLLTLMQQPLWESLLKYYGLDERSDVEERPSRTKKHHQSQR